jgi:hypothetical protein
MKIKFTALNKSKGQEHFEFDTGKLQAGEKLEKFILSTEDDGTIFITPMVSLGACRYPYCFLEPIE